MPGSTWRKAKISGFSCFVANLRSRRGVGDHPSPLVVQTGFPTSLADLVVKNSGRLRKSSPSRSLQKPSSASTSSSSSKKKPPPPPQRPPSPTELAVHASPSDPLGPESHGPEEPREAVGADGANEERRHLSAASPNRVIPASRAVSPNREIPASCWVAAREAAREEISCISEVEVNRSNDECPTRLGFQAKIVLVLILAVCTKDVVVGFMVSAILLLFFEAVGCRLFNWLRSREDGKGDAATVGYSARDAGVGEAAVGVSLSGRTDQSATEIRSSVSLSSRGDGSWDSAVKFDELLASPPTGSERDEEPAATGRTGAVSEAEMEPTQMNKKKKKRKFWSKVVKEKFRSKSRKSKKEPAYVLSSESLPDTIDKGEISAYRGETSAGSLDSSDSDGNEEDDSIDDGNGNGTDRDETLRSEKPNQPMGVGTTMMADKGTITKAKSICLVLMIVVLSGLIGGRFLALTLTVTSCYLLKVSGSLRGQNTQ